MVAGTEPGAVRRCLEALAAAGPADAAALAATVANKRSEKYDGYLTEELLCAGYGSRELDPLGAWRAATALLA